MYRLILVVLIASAIIAIITYAIGRFLKNIKWAKYVPGILTLGISIYNYYLSRQPSEGFEGLGQFISAVILFAAGIGGIIAASLIDFARSRKK